MFMIELEISYAKVEGGIMDYDRSRIRKYKGDCL